MKHSVQITLLLLFLFVLAQINGLFVLERYIDISESAATGTTVVNDEEYGRSNISAPVVENQSLSFVYVLFALLFGTILILLIIKYKQKKIWKSWFFLSVLVTLIISLNPWIFFFLGSLFSSFFIYICTVIFSCILAYYKVFRQHVIIHNITEVFIYAGLAALLVPILNIVSMIIILLAVAAYDMYAVWKSKHMIAMAQFQTEQKVFAGLYIPYQSSEKGVQTQKKSRQKSVSSEKVTSALLGGGDIAFPLLFSGVVMKTTGTLVAPLLITFTTTTALAILFYYGEKGKFYPAIPFIAVGCFVGYGLFLLLP